MVVVVLCLAAGFHPLPLGTASLSWETTAAALVASAAHAQAAAGRRSSWWSTASRDSVARAVQDAR